VPSVQVFLLRQRREREIQEGGGGLFKIQKHENMISPEDIAVLAWQPHSHEAVPYDATP
jgi:hypothetical protein